MTTTARVTVRRATPDDVDALAEVLAEAFHDSAVAGWLIPDPTDRHTIYHRYFTAVLAHGLEHGHVDTVADRSAVAVWYPRLHPPPPPAPTHQAALAEVTGRYGPLFALMEALFEVGHPDEPHHHLAHLAVRPARQGRGLGTALLDHHHRRLDAQGVAAYVATTSPRRGLYQRLGYHTCPPLTLPDGPAVWRLWRPGSAGLPAAFPSTVSPPVDCFSEDPLR
ncbi:GNAT family N-acetyltransferase [Micromonospora fluostatini]|uniref:GNAT family N-acetyltransferase n=1 Tax=Micromonospora sp. JCM 30529 TaxID=3421643 RepID=UPI003D172D85